MQCLGVAKSSWISTLGEAAGMGRQVAAKLITALPMTTAYLGFRRLCAAFAAASEP